MTAKINKLVRYVSRLKVSNVLIIMLVKLIFASIVSIFVFWGNTGVSGFFPRLVVTVMFYGFGTIFVILLRVRATVVAFAWLIVTAPAIYFVNIYTNQYFSRPEITIHGILILPMALQLVVIDFVRIARISKHRDGRK